MLGCCSKLWDLGTCIQLHLFSQESILYIHTLLCRVRLDLSILRTVPGGLPGDRMREVDSSIRQLVFKPHLSPSILHHSLISFSLLCQFSLCL